MFKKIILAALIAGASFQASAADYYVVVPVQGRTALFSGINVGLNSASLPAGVVGQAYAGFDLNSVLAVTGDAAYSGAGVKWELSGGALPSGLLLSANGSITGTPTSSGIHSFSVKATYKTKSGGQSYQVTIANLQAIVSLQADTDANFGSVPLGSTATKVFTISNTGGAPATGVYATTTGDGVSLATANACGTQASPVTIAPAASCKVSVQYSPSQATALVGASVAVVGGGVSGASNISLSGSGVITDPYFSAVSLLMPMDATPFTDVKNTTFTQNGTAVLASGKFGSGSMNVANGSFLTISGAAVELGTGDFTVELWAKVAGYNDGVYRRILAYDTDGQYWAGPNVWELAVYSGREVYSSQQASSVNNDLRNWSHIVLQRSNNVLAIYVNGIKGATTSTYTNNLSGGKTLYVGSAVGNKPWGGQIDDLRITKGVARYSANFTPPTYAAPTQ